MKGNRLHKLFFSVGLFALLITLVVGAKGQSQEVQINLITSGGGATAAWRPIVEKFNKEFAGQYNVDYTTVEHQALREKLMLQFITKTPIYDVFSVLNTWAQEVIAYLEPMNELMEKYNFGDVHKVFGGLIDDYIDDGKILALPLRAGTMLLFYRNDWMLDAGLQPPRSLEEIVQVARKLTRDIDGDGKIDRYGMALKLESKSWTIETFSDFFMPHGGWFLTEDLTEASPSLKGPAAKKTFEMMRTLWAEQLIPDPLGWTYHDAVAAFQTGRLGLADASSVRAALIEDPNVSEAAGKMGYAELPRAQLGSHKPSVYAWSWGFAINADSDPAKKEAAYRFVTYMAQHDNQKWMALNRANGPTVLSVLEDPDYLRLNPASAAIMSTYQKGTRVHTPVPQAADIQQVVHEEIQAMMVGYITIEETCQNIYDRINQIMRQ